MSVSVVVTYASCWGFISFKEEGFSRWRAGTPIHTRAFVIEPLLSKDGYCAQFYIILLSIHDHHNFQVTVFDAMIFTKNFHSVNVIQENLDRSDAPSAQSGDESVWSVDETGNVDYAEATQQFLVEIT